MSSVPTLDVLTVEECLEHLRQAPVGRIAVVVGGSPVVLPVNFRLVEASKRTWIAVRTRRGNVIDTAPMHAAFEIDAIEPGLKEGWSVLVRGTVHRVDPDAADFRERFDPQPWMHVERDAWLAVEPFSITGRRLHQADAAWPFDPCGYL